MALELTKDYLFGKSLGSQWKGIKILGEGTSGIVSLWEYTGDTATASPITQNALHSGLKEGRVIVKSTIFADVYLPYRRKWRPDMYPICDAIGGRHFWMLSICETDEKVVGLILEHSGLKGQYRRRGIFEQSKTPKADFLAFMAHKPLLMSGEYEECFDDGTVTVRIT